MDFNRESKKKIALKSTTWSAISNCVIILTKFLVRTAFIATLSMEYLGLNGLFTSILVVLSLADLGILSAIEFRFYEPIANSDVTQVGRLMNFFHRVYLVIAGVIAIIGLALTPFLKHLISADAVIPGDVNLKVIYLLFLASTVSTYLFSYSQTLVRADQKNYLISKIQITYNLINSIGQIILLLATENYTIVLIWITFSQIVWNFLININIKKMYPEVFAVKENLEPKERKAIYKDTWACMNHKIGSVVLGATDNIVITRMISLVATGLYSNYSLITGGLSSVVSQAMGSFSSTIGIAKEDKSQEEYYDIFKKLTFICWSFAILASVGFFLLVNDFIYIWVGPEFIIDKLAVIFIAANFFCSISRIINITFTNATGLIVKDWARPLIESAINIGISIIGAYYLGIAGVLIGTLVSYALTVGWREPYILYKYQFKRSALGYWKNYFLCILLTVGMSASVIFVKNLLGIDYMTSWLALIFEAVIIGLFIIVILCVFSHKRTEFKYFYNLLIDRFIRKNKNRGE